MLEMLQVETETKELRSGLMEDRIQMKEGVADKYRSIWSTKVWSWVATTQHLYVVLPTNLWLL
jgi:hypothetical protein